MTDDVIRRLGRLKAENVRLESALRDAESERDAAYKRAAEYADIADFAQFQHEMDRLTDELCNTKAENVRLRGLLADEHLFEGMCPHLGTPEAATCPVCHELGLSGPWEAPGSTQGEGSALGGPLERRPSEGAPEAPGSTLSPADPD